MVLLDTRKDRPSYHAKPAVYTIPVGRLDALLSDLDEILEQEAKRTGAHVVTGLYPREGLDGIPLAEMIRCLGAYRERKSIDDLRSGVVRVHATTVDSGRLAGIGVLPVAGSRDYLTLSVLGDAATIMASEVPNLGINPDPVDALLRQYSNPS